MPDLRFSTLQPRDLALIERQPSQVLSLGLAYDYDEEEAAVLAGQAIAWTARESGRILACMGVVETFAGRQGWGWAVLAPGIGLGHIRLTRFIQDHIAGCGLPRLEVLARAADIEPMLAADPAADPRALALRHATPEVRWAQLLGLTAAHVLRQYGAAGETYVLFERIRPALAPAMREAA